MRRLWLYAAAYLACGIVFLALDSVWLTLASQRLYQAEIGAILATRPRLLPAAIFYVIYLAGVVGFCVAPGLARRSPLSALVRGAGFGLVAYATYDLTNQATLSTWSTKITVLDLFWGTTATALSAAVAVAVLRAWIPKALEAE